MTAESPPFADIQRMLMALHPFGPLLAEGARPRDAVNPRFDAADASGTDRVTGAGVDHACQLRAILVALGAVLDHLEPDMNAAGREAAAVFRTTAARVADDAARERALRIAEVRRAIEEAAAWRDADMAAYEDARARAAAAFGLRAPDAEPARPRKQSAKAASGKGRRGGGKTAG